jgi:8-oxo-dGTP pyrophosphatase MutT (NUDIX family)
MEHLHSLNDLTFLRSKLKQDVDPSFYEGDFQAAVSIIISPAKEILFIKRSKNPHDPWSGHIAFPGGKKDPEDEHIIHTAMRETKEEIGLDLFSPSEYAGNLPYYDVTYRQKRTGLVISPHIYLVEDKRSFDLDHTEVERAFWIPVNHLIAKEQRSDKEFTIEDRTLVRPAISYGDDNIWGITYNILEMFFLRLK